MHSARDGNDDGDEEEEEEEAIDRSDECYRPSSSSSILTRSDLILIAEYGVQKRAGVVPRDNPRAAEGGAKFRVDFCKIARSAGI